MGLTTIACRVVVAIFELLLRPADSLSSALFTPNFKSLLLRSLWLLLLLPLLFWALKEMGCSLISVSRLAFSFRDIFLNLEIRHAPLLSMTL